MVREYLTQCETNYVIKKTQEVSNEKYLMNTEITTCGIASAENKDLAILVLQEENIMQLYIAFSSLNLVVFSYPRSSMIIKKLYLHTLPNLRRNNSKINRSIII